MTKNLKDGTHGLGVQQVWIQEQLEVFVEQHLGKVPGWYPGAL